jgi:hypothetical protein
VLLLMNDCPCAPPPHVIHHLLAGQVLDEVFQRSHFLSRHKVELGDEVVVVLEAGVEVSLLAEVDDLLKVGVVDVGVDTEQALEDLLDLKDEVPGEGDIRRWGEELLVVQLGLDPLHELVHVLRGRNLDGLLVDLIGPEVLVLGRSAHDRTSLFRAEESNAAVEKIDLVEEIDGVGREPFVLIFALGQGYCRADVAAPQCLLGLLVQFVSLRSLLEMLALLERLALIREDALLQHFVVIAPRD